MMGFFKFSIYRITLNDDTRDLSYHPCLLVNKAYFFRLNGSIIDSSLARFFLVICNKDMAHH